MLKNSNESMFLISYSDIKYEIEKYGNRTESKGGSS